MGRGVAPRCNLAHSAAIQFAADGSFSLGLRITQLPAASAAGSVSPVRTAPASKRDVSFVWGGDVAGQGWGINPDDGGMFTFATMRKHRPDFLLHSGDTVYADGPIQREVTLADGKVWKNVTTPEKAKVAETLDEFRAAGALIVAVNVGFSADGAERLRQPVDFSLPVPAGGFAPRHESLGVSSARPSDVSATNARRGIMVSRSYRRLNRYSNSARYRGTCFSRTAR